MFSNIIITNSLFAHYLNKEKFNWKIECGLTLLTLCGVAACIIAVPKNSHSYTSQEMIKLFSNLSFIIYSALLSLLIILLTGMKLYYKRIKQPSNWQTTFRNMSYGALAGSLGGMNVTLTKTIFSLITGEWDKGGIVLVLSSYLFWCVLTILITSYVIQIWLTAIGLENCSSIIIISTHAIVEEIISILGGLFYFQDYLLFETWNWIVFILGIIASLIAVIFLVHYKSNQNSDEI